MVNGKKGFIRIVEAIIAIVIVFGFIIIAFPQGRNQATGETPFEIEQTQARIIDEITNNVEYRKCILNLTRESQKDCGRRLFGSFITQGTTMDYSFEITNMSRYVLLDKKEVNIVPIDKDVYTKSVIVSVDDVLAKDFKLDLNKRYYKFTLFLWYNV